MQRKPKAIDAMVSAYRRHGNRRLDRRGRPPLGTIINPVTWGIVNPREYGAKGDGKIITDAAIAAGSKILTSKQAGFKPTDVGKLVGITGSSTALGEVTHRTIAKYISAEKVELSGEASKEVTAAEAVFGTNDGPALTAAQEACPTYKYTAGVLAPGPGAVLYTPAGIYVTSEEWATKNKVRIIGDGLEQTIFAPIVGSVFINAPEQGTSAPLTGAAFELFQIRASWAYSETGVYSASLKVLKISQEKYTRCEKVMIVDAPATSFPFDQSKGGTTITGCVAINSGRLNSGTEPGGSGFGMGTLDVGDQDPITVTGNFAVGCKRYGIFVEGQGGGNPATGTQGIRIENNYCYGNKAGIGSSGGTGTIISGNQCIKNKTAGIALDAGTLITEEKGYLAPFGLVTGNYCAENEEDGIRLDGSQNEQAQWNDLVTGNICAFNTIHGIALLAAAVNITGLDITNNIVAFNKGSGIRSYYPTGTVSAKCTNSTFSNNVVFNNGGTAGNTDGMKLEVKNLNMTIDNNRCFDTNGTSGVQEHGILITGGYEGGSFRNNDIRNNKKESQIVFSGTQPNDSAALGGNLGWTTFPAPVNQSVTASPMTYKGKLVPEWLFIFGGTVSSVTIGAVQVASSSNVVIPIESGDEPVITYSAAPTIVRRKR